MEFQIDIVIKQRQVFALVGDGHPHPIRKWHREKTVKGTPIFRAHLQRQTDKVARLRVTGPKKIAQWALYTGTFFSVPECSQYDLSYSVVAITRDGPQNIGPD